jgi:hypothetical protein
LLSLHWFEEDDGTMKSYQESLWNGEREKNKKKVYHQFTTQSQFNRTNFSQKKKENNSTYKISPHMTDPTFEPTYSLLCVTDAYNLYITDLNIIDLKFQHENY